MLPYQQRVVHECEELTVKIEAMIEFLDTGIFNNLPTEDRRLLLDQINAMQNYQSILDKRIARFKVK